MSILAMISIAGVSIVPHAVAQPSSTSNVTKNDSLEKMLASAGATTMAGGGANNYSAWLFVCKAPPITSAETDCDPPVRLH